MSKLLSQGGFGCVFYPGIRCDDASPDDEVVTKVQNNDFNAKNEIIIGSLVEKLPLYQWYFLPVINDCPINIKKLNKESVMSCDVFSEATNKSKLNFIAMDIPYINGTDFVSLIEKSETKKGVLILSEAYRHLLTCLEKLEELSIIHLDIKLDNILFEKNNGQPRIIDFGISIPIKNLSKKTLKTYFYAYVPEYYLWCPTIHLINFCLHETDKKLTSDDLAEVASQCVSLNRSLDMFSPNFVDKYREQLLKFFETFKGNKPIDVVDKLLKYKNTWDQYSLSIMYLNILFSIFPDASNGNTFILMFSKLLLKNIHPDPSLRLTISETRNNFDNIFFIEGDISTYLSLATSFNENKTNAIDTLRYNTMIDTPYTRTT